MRHTRSVSLRMRLKKKKNQTRFWGQASFRRYQKIIKKRLHRQHRLRMQAEYVLLADYRLNELENIKLIP